MAHDDDSCAVMRKGDHRWSKRLQMEQPLNVYYMGDEARAAYLHEMAAARGLGHVTVGGLRHDAEEQAANEAAYQSLLREEQFPHDEAVEVLERHRQEGWQVEADWGDGSYKTPDPRNTKRYEELAST